MLRVPERIAIDLIPYFRTSFLRTSRHSADRFATADSAVVPPAPAERLSGMCKKATRRTTSSRHGSVERAANRSTHLLPQSGGFSARPAPSPVAFPPHLQRRQHRLHTAAQYG